MKITGMSVCPFCGSENWEWMNDDDGIDNYHCHECDSWFDEKDYEFEDLRHKISARLTHCKATEENPLVFNYPVIIGEEEAQGLSSLQMPHVVSIFQDNECIIWINEMYCTEPSEFDILTLNEAKDILAAVEEAIETNG